MRAESEEWGAEMGVRGSRPNDHPREAPHRWDGKVIQSPKGGSGRDRAGRLTERRKKASGHPRGHRRWSPLSLKRAAGGFRKIPPAGGLLSPRGESRQRRAQGGGPDELRAFAPLRRQPIGPVPLRTPITGDNTWALTLAAGARALAAVSLSRRPLRPDQADEKRTCAGPAAPECRNRRRGSFLRIRNEELGVRNYGCRGGSGYDVGAGALAGPVGG